jgi:hypothetical protein
VFVDTVEYTGFVSSAWHASFAVALVVVDELAYLLGFLKSRSLRVGIQCVFASLAIDDRRGMCDGV